MLKVSSNNITFGQSQTIKSLTLQNQFPNNIIFKIKVSAVGHLSIQPSKGFIRANSAVSFIIKSLKNEKFQIKVLFTYGFILGKNGEFNEDWEKIKQNEKFEHSIIIVKRSEVYRGNPKMAPLIKESEVQDKKKQAESRSPRINSMEKKRNQKSVPKLNTQSLRKKSPRRGFQASEKSPRRDFQAFEQFSLQQFIQQQRDDCLFYSTQEVQQFIEKCDNTEKSLDLEKIKNTKLIQQLSISEAKLKEITEDKMYIETHKSIGIICEDYHTTFTFLVIIGLASFVLGFFFGKIQASIV